jgi:outer membrane protein
MYLFTRQNIKISWVLAICLVSGIFSLVRAEDTPDHLRQVIEDRFPGADIKEIESEVWEGQPVTEVEITTQGGAEYEIFVSKSGEILHIAEEKELPVIGGELTIGFGLRAEREIYKNADTEFEPMPFLAYEKGPFEIQGYDGISATFRLHGNDRFEVGLVGTIMMEEGYDTDDDYFKGMDKLDSYLYGGGLDFAMTFAGWEICLGILQDISGEYDGQEAELSFAYPWSATEFEFTPKLSLTWLSEKSVDYFYGISAKEARPDRPAYSPGSSFEMEAELMIQRPIYGNFSIIGLLGVSTFGSEITDSSLVDEDYEIEGVIGVTYTF